MIVTIDGPAGAGKSTVARALAARLGFRFLDTGAMYRAVALAAARRELDWNDPARLVDVVRSLRIELDGEIVRLNDEDVSEAIRTSEITNLTHYAANNPGVRAVLVEHQKLAGRDGDVVTEGRDQGTVVFPHAECKFFLTASPEERARRRLIDLAERGENLSLAEVLAQQEQRDHRDTQRSVGPLVAAGDAVEVVTDGMTRQQVVERLDALVRQRLSGVRGD